MKKKFSLIFLLSLLVFSLSGCAYSSYNIEDIPEYENSPYCVLNDNRPSFAENEITDESFTDYGDLDELGRCTYAKGCLGKDLFPKEDRENISDVHPSGWQSAYYDFIDGNFLYNRCHLIAFMLTGENDNEKNLITGTRYMNIEGMLPFEQMVHDYIYETENHVMYKVTPVFEDNNLVAEGVIMEALSVEDDGEGIMFCIFCYNVQPGVEIDYSTGDSVCEEENTAEDDTKQEYVLNTNTMKFHKPSCSSVKDISENNKKEVKAKRDTLIQEGYSPCGNCKP